MPNNQLTPEEEAVIVHKGTEAPHSGEYDQHWGEGYYVCKRCGAKLFKSDDKFEAHCGWPSFDKAVPGAVEQLPDPDGVRTEVQCANCGAHLGHVFLGENFTKENQRYCINSIALKFFKKDAK